MGNLSVYGKKKRIWISIFLGVLSFLLSPYCFKFVFGEITVNIPWSIVLPILASMTFGWKYGLLSGLTGGAYYPFLLWANDGWVNLSTTIFYLIIFSLIGLIHDAKYFKKVQKLPVRILLVMATCIAILTSYFLILFNPILSLNPPFWQHNSIKSLPREALYGLIFKESLNWVYFILISETLTMLPVIRKLLGIPTKQEFHDNTKIFIITLSVFFFIWLSFIGLGFTLLRGTDALHYGPIALSLLVILSSGFLTTRILIYYHLTQVRIQESLAKSEEKYRSLFENSNDAIFVLKDRVFIDCNQKALEIFACTLNEIIGKTIYFFSPSHQPDGMLSEEKSIHLSNLALQGKAQRVEWVHSRLDSSLFDAEISLSSLNSNTHEPLLQSIVRDISDRKKAEKSVKSQFRLQQMLMKMSATFINMPLENIESGIQSSLEELGEFVYADRVRIWEYDFSKQIANLTQEWCRGEHKAKISNYQELPFASFVDFDVEMHRRGEIISVPDVSSLPSGHLKELFENEETRSIITVPLMSMGECLGFVGLNWVRHSHLYSDEEIQILKFFALMIVNIWHRRQSEEILMRTKTRLVRGESIAKFGNWELNMDTLILTASEGAMKIYGANKSSMTLEEVRKFILPEYHLLQDKAYEDLMKRGEPYNLEFKIINGQSGEFVDIQSIAEYDHKTRTIFGTIQDITDRKESEKAIKESEEKYRELADSIPVGIFETNITRQITFSNKTALEWFGANEKNFKDLTIANFIVSQDHEKMSENFNNKIRDVEFKTSSAEYTAQRNDGRTFPVIISSFPISKNGSIIGVRGVIIDITQRKQAEEALRESESKLRAIFECSRDAIGVSKHGVHIFANPSYLKLFGFENNEKILGSSIFESIAPSHRQQMIQNVQQRSAREPVPAFYESRGMNTDGREFDAEFSVSSYELEGEIYSVATIRDITERKKAEEELNKLFHAIEQSPVSIIITDPEGAIEYANPYFTHLTGYSLNEVKEQNPRIFKSGHTSEAEYEQMWTKISSGKEWNGEFYNKKKNGEYYWEAASISAVINDMGIITNYIAVKEDITEKKEADRRILQAVIDTEENERKRFSRELHDGLGPIMSAVKLYFHLLADNKEPEKKSNLLDRGNRSIDEGILLLREISNNLSPRVLNDFGIVSAINNFINLLNETEKLFIDFKYNADKRYDKNIEITLYRITTELINNTMKYAGTNKAEVRLNYWYESSLIILEYRDFGKGFEPEENISSKKGLGLVNIQQRVNSLNGKLVFNTAPGQGVNVRIELPVESVNK